MDTPEALQPSENAPGGIATPAAGSLCDVPHVYRPAKSEPDGVEFCSVCGGLWYAALRGDDEHQACEWDRCRLLVYPQKRFATAKCRTAHHDRLHPRINPPGLGLRDQGSIKERIRRHLLGLEGRHATAFEISQAISEHESTTHRELRKLRALGCPIQTGRPNGHRAAAVFWIPKGAA